MLLLPATEIESHDLKRAVDATCELIVEAGGIDIPLPSIAKQANIDLPIIEAMFPTPAKAIEHVLQRFFNRIRATIKAAIDETHSIEAMPIAIEKMVSAFYLNAIHDQTMMIVWDQYRQFPSLIELEDKDSQINARILTEKLIQLQPELNYDEIFQSTWLLIQMVSMTTSESTQLDEAEALGLIQEYKNLATIRLNSYIST